MADTLGSLVDKLITTNLKLWHVQDKVHEADVKGTGLDAKTVHDLSTLNRQRNLLMSEIDGILKDAVESGMVNTEVRTKF